jgi:hypothetical protein
VTDQLIRGISNASFLRDLETEAVLAKEYAKKQAQIDIGDTLYLNSVFILLNKIDPALASTIQANNAMDFSTPESAQKSVRLWNQKRSEISKESVRQIESLLARSDLTPEARRGLESGAISLRKSDAILDKLVQETNQDAENMSDRLHTYMNANRRMFEVLASLNNSLSQWREAMKNPEFEEAKLKEIAEKFEATKKKSVMYNGENLVQAMQEALNQDTLLSEAERNVRLDQIDLFGKYLKFMRPLRANLIPNTEESMNLAIADIREGRAPEGYGQWSDYKIATGRAEFWDEMTEVVKDDKNIGAKLQDAFKFRVLRDYWGVHLYKVSTHAQDKDVDLYGVAMTGPGHATSVAYGPSYAYLRGYSEPGVENPYEIAKDHVLRLAHTDRIQLTKDGKLVFRQAGEIDWYTDSQNRHHAYRVDLDQALSRGFSVGLFGETSASEVSRSAKTTGKFMTLAPEGRFFEIKPRDVVLKSDAELYRGGLKIEYAALKGTNNTLRNFSIEIGPEYSRDDSDNKDRGSVRDIYSEDAAQRYQAPSYTGQKALYLKSRAEFKNGKFTVAPEVGADKRGAYFGTVISMDAENFKPSLLVAQNQNGSQTVGISLANVTWNHIVYDFSGSATLGTKGHPTTYGGSIRTALMDLNKLFPRAPASAEPFKPLVTFNNVSVLEAQSFDLEVLKGKKGNFVLPSVQAPAAPEIKIVDVDAPAKAKETGKKPLVLGLQGLDEALQEKDWLLDVAQGKRQEATALEIKQARPLSSIPDDVLRQMKITVAKSQAGRIYSFVDKNGSVENNLTDDTLVLPKADGFLVLDLGGKTLRELQAQADKPVIDFKVDFDPQGDYFKNGSVILNRKRCSYLGEPLQGLEPIGEFLSSPFSTKMEIRSQTLWVKKF